jgi:hypothetical protein
MDFFQTHWGWITSDPWAFGAFAVLFLGFGWGVAKLVYEERIAILKERVERPSGATPPASPKSFAFDYQAQGRHGRNVLASSTHDTIVGEFMSLQAIVPQASHLHVVLTGPPQQLLSDNIAAWSMSVVGIVNWTFGRYQETTQETSQHFNAEGGSADLQIAFHRPGAILV